MEPNHGGRDVSRMVFGAILIILGLLFTLDRFDVIDAGNFSDYWSLILVAVGIAKVMQPPGSQGRGFGAVLIVIGVLVLLENLDIIEYSVWDFWPLILVLIGVSLLMRATGVRVCGSQPPPAPLSSLDEGLEAGPGNAERPRPVSTGPERVFATAILGGVERRVTSDDFRGGSLTAVMGGCELDLRQAAIASSPAVLDVFAMWGGIDLRVPPEWTVKVEGTPIMGAIEDHTSPGRGSGAQVLIIRGVAIMGGVEIKN